MYLIKFQVSDFVSTTLHNIQILQTLVFVYVCVIISQRQEQQQKIAKKEISTRQNYIHNQPHNKRKVNKLYKKKK